MALPDPDCFKWLDVRHQFTAIYEALYTAAGSDPSLVTPECFLGQDERQQITDIYAAILLLDGDPSVDIPTSECFKGMDVDEQLSYIYEALYEASPDASGLLDPTCFGGNDLREQLTNIYEAFITLTEPSESMPTPECFRGMDIMDQMAAFYEAAKNLVDNPPQEFDPDAQSYFDRVAATDPITTADKVVINDFIVQLKADGLWTGLTAGWIGRSQYNAGTGTILYELKSNTNNGTIENTAWSTDGQVYNAASDRVTTPLSHTMNTNFSAVCVFKDSVSDIGINRFIIGLTSGAAILGLPDANKASTPYATFMSTGAGVSNAGNVTAFNCATVASNAFLPGASTIGYYRNGSADGFSSPVNSAANTGNVILGDANGSPWGSPSDGVISLVLIYQGAFFDATAAANLYTNIKNTVGSGLSLP